MNNKILLIENFNHINTYNEKNKLYFEGIFGLADKKNLNGRLYPRKIMEKAIEEYNKNYILKKRALGELDHPDSATVSLKNVAFIIEDPLTINENGEVIGRGRILEDLPMGKIAANLLKEGIIIGLSSRGLGEIIEKEVFDNELGENITVNEVSDFLLSSFDLVSEPSINRYINLINNKEKKDSYTESRKLTTEELIIFAKLLF